MHIETTRFGTVEVDDSRIVSFPSGLLGFFELPTIRFFSSPMTTACSTGFSPWNPPISPSW